MIKRLLFEENGQSMVLVAIFLTILIGFAGLAIDGGRLYLAKSQLQKAVDAGALAGADAMLTGIASSNNYNYIIAKNTAVEIAIQNYSNSENTITYAANALPEVPSQPEQFIEVDGTENVNLMLMPVLGISNSKVVRAKAKVKIGKIVSADQGALMPIGLNLEDNKLPTPGTIVDLTPGAGSGSSGNYNFLDFSPLDDPATAVSGAPGVGYYIDNGSPSVISVGQSLETQPGNIINSVNVSPFINKRVGQIIYVPIVTEFGNGTSDPVTVLGFAAFKLVGISGQKIKASFLYEVFPGEIGSVTTEYGTYASELVE